MFSSAFFFCKKTVYHFISDRPLINPISDITVVEGNYAIFPCSASSKPVSTFKWYRKGNGTILKEGIGTPGNNGITFNMTNVRRTDAATYQCNADNGVETSDNKNVLLTVHCKSRLHRILIFIS